MNPFIAAGLTAACVLGGTLGARAVKPAPAIAVSAPANDAGAKTPAGAEGAAAKGKAGAHHADGHSYGSDTSYHKFSREFIVPMAEGDSITGLAILHLALEVDPDVADKLFAMDPKLRDTILQALIGLANDGHTFEHFASVESYESIRSVVLLALQELQPEGIRNVLILDLARQDTQ